MVSRRDIAARAGVSEMTVTRVVTGKGYVSEKTRQLVQKCVDEMSYIPNKIAANLVSRKSNAIAVILPDLTNPYYMQLVEEMISEAKRRGQIVMLFRANEGEINSVLDDIISNRVCGVVNMALFEVPIKYVKQMQAMGMRLVHGGYDDDKFSVRMNYAPAMKRAFELFRRDGRKKVAFIAGFGEHQVEHDSRIRFFREYCKEFGYGEESSPILRGNYPAEKIYVVGRTLADELLREHPDVDAVFCLNDMMAFGAVNCFKGKGLRIPQDMAVVGFDNLQISEYFDPPLTTIAADIKAEAKAYVDYIGGDIEGGVCTLDCELHLRKSLREREGE